MNFTTDQLSYVLERKFNNLRTGRDVLIVCSADGPDDNGVYTPLADAYIIQWNVKYLPKPTTEELDEWWEVLKDQYDSDPTRVDSAMFQFVQGTILPKIPQITINTDI